MAITQNPKPVQPAFNEVEVIDNENTSLTVTQLEPEPQKSVTLTKVKVGDSVTFNLKGFLDRMFLDSKEAINSTGETGWAFKDYRVYGKYSIGDGNQYHILNAVCRRGESLDLVNSGESGALTYRPSENGKITIPKYEGFPVGIGAMFKNSYGLGGAIIIGGEGEDMIVDQVNGVNYFWSTKLSNNRLWREQSLNNIQEAENPFPAVAPKSVFLRIKNNLMFICGSRQSVTGQNELYYSDDLGDTWKITNSLIPGFSGNYQQNAAPWDVYFYSNSWWVYGYRFMNTDTDQDRQSYANAVSLDVPSSQWYLTLRSTTGFGKRSNSNIEWNNYFYLSDYYGIYRSTAPSAEPTQVFSATMRGYGGSFYVCNNRLFCCTEDGAVYYTTNGTSWSEISGLQIGIITAIAYRQTTGYYAFATANGRIYFTKDLVTFTRSNEDSKMVNTQIIYDSFRDKFLFGGSNGIIWQLDEADQGLT